MKEIEVHFCNFINIIRTKRACNELLKYKQKTYSTVAKKAGLRLEEIQKERKQIIQDMNNAEEFKFKSEEDDSPLDFIKNSKLFDKLKDNWFDEISTKIM